MDKVKKFFSLVWVYLVSFFWKCVDFVKNHKFFSIACVVLFVLFLFASCKGLYDIHDGAVIGSINSNLDVL